jgi:peptide/nickel transport system substrate-binding protein
VRICFAALLAMMLVGCSRAASESGVLRVAIATEPHSLDPISMRTGQEMVVDRLFSDPLTSFDPTGNRIVPILASRVPTTSNGDISPDGLRITYHLRHGVRWQDGAPFTSADVLFTFAAVMNPKNDVISRFGYDDVASADAPDAYTVRFRLHHRFAPIVTTLFGDETSPLGMLPKHLLERYASLTDIPFDALPIGTGPFRVVAWKRGDRLELVANPQYFLGAPKLSRVTVFFSRNEQTLVTMAQAHEIEWAAELSPTLVPELRAIHGYRVVLVPQNRWFGLTFNLARPAMRDLRVRRAIEFAIDKARLAAELTEGTAQPASQDLPEFLWASPHLPPTRYDPAAALALLAAAGYGSAHPLHLDLAFNQSDQTSRRAAVVIQGELASAGVVAELHGYPNEMLTGLAQVGGVLAGGRFDLALSRILNGPDPDNSAEYRCAAVSPNGFNFARYCSPRMETLQDDALDHYDRAQRATAYASIERLLEADLPQIPLWWPKDVHLVSRRLHHFDPNPFVETWNAWQWSLAPQ